MEGVLFVAAIILVALFIIKAVLDGQQNAETVTNIKDRIRRLDGFEPADVYVSSINLTGVAIDVGHQEIVLANENALRRFELSSIVSCEILEDDTQLAYVNRGSQLAGVAVGGILFGGVGAVIGSLSASKRSINNVKMVVLRFVTDDFDSPKYDIVLLDASFRKKGLNRDSLLYRQALKTGELWHGRVMAMMRAGASHDNVVT